MDWHEAKKLAEQQYPNMIVTGAAEADGAWFFGFDFPGVESYPSSPGLPMLAVRKDTGEVRDMSPGSPAFDEYTPTAKQLDIKFV